LQKKSLKNLFVVLWKKQWHPEFLVRIFVNELKTAVKKLVNLCKILGFYCNVVEVFAFVGCGIAVVGSL